MSDPIQVREFVPSDADSVDRLMTRFFGDWSADRVRRRRQWELEAPRGCSLLRPVCLVAETGGAIVGHISAFPIPLRVLNERIEVLSPGGFVVDQEHRWAAIALLRNLLSRASIFIGSGWSQAAERLFRFFHATHLPLSQVRYVYPLRCTGATCRELRYRFPDALYWLANRASAIVVEPLLRRRRGWKTKPLPKCEHGGELHITPIERFGEEYDALWKAATAQFEVSIDKDAAYLNWRYLECPTLSPICLGCRNRANELVGVLVACRRLHRDRARRPCGADGEIVELVVRDAGPAVTRLLLISAMQILNRRRVDVVAATGLQRRFHPLLEEIGFEPSQCPWGTLFAVSTDPNHPVESLMQSDRWYVTSGDGDHLFDQGV